MSSNGDPSLDRRAQRTRAALRDALISLIGERGWEDLAVQDICERANVGRSTFYLHYAGKEALLESNRKALRLGYDYALANFACPLPIRIRRANAVGDRVFIDGNNASALGCIYGGATVCAWYPITPLSSLAEAVQKHCR